MKFIRRLYNLGSAIEELREHLDDEECRRVLNSISNGASGLTSYTARARSGGTTAKGSASRWNIRNSKQEGSKGYGEKQVTDLDHVWESKDPQRILGDYGYEMFGTMVGVRSTSVS